MKGRFLVIVVVLINCIGGFAQNHAIDSLRSILKTEKEDTNKLKTLNRLCEKLWRIGNYDSSMADAAQAQVLAEKIISSSQNAIVKAGEIGLAITYKNMGAIYRHHGNYPKALEYDLNALDLYQKIGNKNGIASLLGNIGIVYWNQENYPKAREYYLKAFDINKETGNKELMASNIGNIGIIYKDEGNYPKALEYYSKALSIMQDLGDMDGIATNLGNIGDIYSNLGEYKKALEYDFKAMNITRKLGEQGLLAVNLIDVGNLYRYEKEYSLAKVYYDSAMVLAKKIGETDQIRDAYGSMADLDSATGNYKAEAENYKKYIIYRDSLQNEANTKKLVQTQMNYEFDRKTDSTKAAQDKLNLIAAKESQHQKMLLYSFIGGFILMLALAFFIFIGYQQKQKSNIIITQQKELVEEKNKEILDSINYAKRLQEAILPPVSLIKKSFPDSFLLYQPKDIVAGDFYWMEKSGDNILIAAADCTGHGVPGALVSIVCSNALNRTVKEFHIIEPGKILNKVRELVLETFEKSESNVQDGMDISLCCINKETNDLKWSGAYNSLWYIKGGEMKEVIADKQPIGKQDRTQPFNTHNLHLQKGDALYLFTDGYADQFGGPKGKKFKYKQLQDILLANATKSMEEQKTILEGHLEDWKGDLEQVDDILIMGIRV